MVTSHSFHCMILLLAIDQCVFRVFVFDVSFYYNLSDTFCGLVVFTVVFDILNTLLISSERILLLFEGKPRL